MDDALARDSVKYEFQLGADMFGVDEGDVDELVDMILDQYEQFGDARIVRQNLQSQMMMGQMLGIAPTEDVKVEDLDMAVNNIVDRYNDYRAGDVEVDQHPAAESAETATGNILEEANETVGQRAEEYGPPTENYKVIADMWAGYLGIELTPYDYSQMMNLAKIGRTKTGSPDRDTHLDQAGYSQTTDLVFQDGAEPAPYHSDD